MEYCGWVCEFESLVKGNKELSVGLSGWLVKLIFGVRYEGP